MGRDVRRRRFENFVALRARIMSCSSSSGSSRYGATALQKNKRSKVNAGLDSSLESPRGKLLPERERINLLVTGSPRPARSH